MYEVLLNISMSIIAGFGGATAVFFFLKFLIKKWVEKAIELQIDKSMKKFEQKIKRKDGMYDLRIQREFIFYDKIQDKSYLIKSSITECILYLLNNDFMQFQIAVQDLVKQSYKYNQLIEGNKEYLLHTDLLNALDNIESNLKQLVNIDTSNEFTVDDITNYDSVAQKTVISINLFLDQLGDYINDATSLL